MSYSLISPPPTAVPLPVVAVANENSPYYAPASGGGGGGGGAGPNPSFSSINLSTSANVNMLGGGFIQVFGSDVGINIQNNDTTAVNEIGMITNGTAAAVYPNLTGNGTYISLSAPSANSGLSMFAGDNEGQFIIGAVNSAGGPSTLTIISGGELRLITAPGAPTSLSSLNVSSINGASPAGGGVAPAGISTNAVDAATTTKLRLNGTNGITIDTAGTGTVTINSVLINAVTSDLQISSINGAAPGGAAISTFDVASVSSLTVSSINGQAPGGGIANTSTGSLAQSFVLTSGGPPVVAVTSAFNTTAGNLYNLSWQDTAFVNGSLAGPNSYIQYSISSSAGFLPVDVVPAAPLSSFAISSLLNHNYNFKAEADSGQLVLSQNGLPSTFIGLVAGQDIVLRDLGPVV